MKTHKAKPRKAIVRPRAVKGGDASAPSLERDAVRIVKVIESGCSAFVWCKEGKRADDAIRAAAKRLSSEGYEAIDMLLPVSYHPTYEGNFSSRVGKSLYPDSETEMDEVALLNRLKNEKRRIVIFMTRLNFAVQGNAATPQMNSWARFLVSLLECIPVNKVFLIIGSSMSPAEMKERFTESEPLPFKGDQVVPISPAEEATESKRMEYDSTQGQSRAEVIRIDVSSGEVCVNGEEVKLQNGFEFALLLLLSKGVDLSNDAVTKMIEFRGWVCRKVAVNWMKEGVAGSPRFHRTNGTRTDISQAHRDDLRKVLCGLKKRHARFHELFPKLRQVKSFNTSVFEVAGEEGLPDGEQKKLKELGFI